MFMSLQEISVQVQECKKCRLWQTAKHGVPGEGPSDAKIMFVGQNPGAEEDQTGRPFVGRAGKFLTKTLAEFGIKREDVYITNIVKHTSPENRKPYSDEVTACLPYLNQQIALIKPKIIVLLGASAKKPLALKESNILRLYILQQLCGSQKCEKNSVDKLGSLQSRLMNLKCVEAT